MTHNPYYEAANELARKLASRCANAGKVPSLAEAERMLEAEEERQRQEAREYGARKLIAHAQALIAEREDRAVRAKHRDKIQPVTKNYPGRS